MLIAALAPRECRLVSITPAGPSSRPTRTQICPAFRPRRRYRARHTLPALPSLLLPARLALDPGARLLSGPAGSASNANERTRPATVQPLRPIAAASVSDLSPRTAQPLGCLHPPAQGAIRFGATRKTFSNSKKEKKIQMTPVRRSRRRRRDYSYSMIL